MRDRAWRRQQTRKTVKKRVRKFPWYFEVMEIFREDVKRIKGLCRKTSPISHWDDDWFNDTLDRKRRREELDLNEQMKELEGDNDA